MDGGLTGFWPIDLLLGLAAVLGALVVIKRRAVDPVRRVARQVRKLLYDLYGQDPDDVLEGQSPAPGVFRRIETIENSTGAQLDEIKDSVKSIKFEVESNGPSNSLRNIAIAAAAQAAQTAHKVDDLAEKLDEHVTWSEALVAQQESRMAGLTDAIEELRQMPSEDEPDR